VSRITHELFAPNDANAFPPSVRISSECSPSRKEVLDHDIRFSGEPHDEADIVRRPEVGSDRQLAPVHAQEVGALSIRVEGWSPPAGLVADAGTLDLMTSAPMSPSIMVQRRPASTRIMSSILRLLSMMCHYDVFIMFALSTGTAPLGGAVHRTLRPSSSHEASANLA
jgi:hypothetical protein